MASALQAADNALFVFFNSTISNRVFDVVMPALTDWHKSPVGLAIAGILIALFLWKGGRKARIVVLLTVVLILCTDQLSSSVIKFIVERPRPCHTVNGMQVVPVIHLLVDCGSGYSFPSSHAVNNFGFAFFYSHYYRSYAPYFYGFAALISMSRIIVGVHFPSDVAGGAIIGMIVAALLIAIWDRIGALVPAVAIRPELPEYRKRPRS